MKKQKVKSKILKEKEGITLIALVITIIVLLILAGVSIATLTGDNGILTQATKAKEETEIATDEEQRKLAMAEAATNLENTEYIDKKRKRSPNPSRVCTNKDRGRKYCR